MELKCEQSKRSSGKDCEQVGIDQRLKVFHSVANALIFLVSKESLSVAKRREDVALSLEGRADIVFEANEHVPPHLVAVVKQIVIALHRAYRRDRARSNDSNFPNRDVVNEVIVERDRAFFVLAESVPKHRGASSVRDHLKRSLIDETQDE